MLDGMCISLLDASGVAARMSFRMKVMTNYPSGWSRALLALGLAHCGGPHVDAPAADPPPAVPPGPPVTIDGEPSVHEITLAPIDGPEGDTPTSGGQTGDDSGSIGLECDLVTTRGIALDEPSPLGFAPNDAIALALGSRALPLRWLSPVYDADGVLLDYATRAWNEVELSVQLRDDQARLLERTDSTYGVRCEDQLVVDVNATLTSADGALDEQFDATLHLYAGVASLEVALPVATLGGTFAFDPPELRGLPPAGLSVHVAFTRYGQSGDIGQRYDDGTSSTGFSIADWPSGASCDFVGITPVLNELTPSVADVLQIVRDAPSDWTLINAAGESAPLQIDLTATPESSCFSPARFAQIGSSDSRPLDELVVHAELTLDSTGLPAPIRVPLDVVGQFEATSEAIETVFFSQRLMPCATGGYYSPADFVTHCGDWGVDVSGYTAVSIEVQDARFGPSGHYAAFRLRGDHYPGCTPSPDGYVCAETGVGVLRVENVGEVQIFAR
jgi:hypothetical protein